MTRRPGWFSVARPGPCQPRQTVSFRSRFARSATAPFGGQYGITGQYTFDEGASASIDVGIGLQQRGRNSLGRYTSQTAGVGGAGTFWTDSGGLQNPLQNIDVAAYGGTQNRSGGGSGAINSGDVAIGINFGPVTAGILVDPSRVTGNFVDSYNALSR